jgi:hypothetical protein
MPIIMFIAAVACIIKANIVFYQILDEVNANRPPNQQTSFIFVNVRAFDILSQHAALFTTSRKRKPMYLWTGVGFVLLFSAFPLCVAWLLPLLPARPQTPN